MEVIDLDDTRPGNALTLAGEPTEHLRIPCLHRLDVRLGRKEMHVIHADGSGERWISKYLHTNPAVRREYVPLIRVHIANVVLGAARLPAGARRLDVLVDQPEVIDDG